MGAQGHDMEPAPAGTAAGLGHPIFFGGGADRHPDAGGLRALCPGVWRPVGQGQEGSPPCWALAWEAVLFLDFSGALPFWPLRF